MTNTSDWFVYMVRCGDGTLYTGVATNVERRLSEHRSGSLRSARYLRGRGPFSLVLKRRIGSRSRALKVEHRIKKLNRAEKENLIGIQEVELLI